MHWLTVSVQEPIGQNPNGTAFGYGNRDARRILLSRLWYAAYLAVGKYCSFAVRRIKIGCFGSIVSDDTSDMAPETVEGSPVRRAFRQEVHRHGEASFQARAEVVCMTL